MEPKTDAFASAAGPKWLDKGADDWSNEKKHTFKSAERRCFFCKMRQKPPEKQGKIEKNPHVTKFLFYIGAAMMYNTEVKAKWYRKDNQGIVSKVHFRSVDI